MVAATGIWRLCQPGCDTAVSKYDTPWNERALLSLLRDVCPVASRHAVDGTFARMEELRESAESSRLGKDMFAPLLVDRQQSQHDGAELHVTGSYCACIMNRLTDLLEFKKALACRHSCLPTLVQGKGGPERKGQDLLTFALLGGRLPSSSSFGRGTSTSSVVGRRTLPGADC